jgi:hypothetical protein
MPARLLNSRLLSVSGVGGWAMCRGGSDSGCGDGLRSSRHSDERDSSIPSAIPKEPPETLVSDLEVDVMVPLCFACTEMCWPSP